ncbi:hypothetical protein [Stetteria hydrogenophila]
MPARLVRLAPLDCGDPPGLRELAGVLARLVGEQRVWETLHLEGGSRVAPASRQLCWGLRLLGASLAPASFEAPEPADVPLGALGVYDRVKDPPFALAYPSPASLSLAPTPLAGLGSLWGVPVYAKLEYLHPLKPAGGSCPRGAGVPGSLQPAASGLRAAVELDLQLRALRVKPRAVAAPLDACCTAEAIAFYARHRLPGALAVAVKPLWAEAPAECAELGARAGPWETVEVSLEDAVKAAAEAFEASGVNPGPLGGAALAAIKKLALEGSLDGPAVAVLPDAGHRHPQGGGSA